MMAATFLSCLRGSEPTLEKECVLHDFLSCLRGSELFLKKTLTST